MLGGRKVCTTKGNSAVVCARCLVSSLEARVLCAVCETDCFPHAHTVRVLALVLIVTPTAAGVHLAWVRKQAGLAGVCGGGVAFHWAEK